MERKILSYGDFVGGKRPANNESTNPEEVNEGFLDSLLRFFKGLFDLISDKKVKKESEAISNDLNKIIDDENVADDEIEEELDVKRVRRSADAISAASKQRIQVDEEKGIKTLKGLTDSLASWWGMIIVQQESTRIPMLQKMMKNPDTAKRFTWVPEKWSNPNATEPVKNWYKTKECVADKNVLQQILKAVESPMDKQKEAIMNLSKFMIENFMKTSGSAEGMKKNNAEDIMNAYRGFAAMCTSIIETMMTIVKNTADDKLAEVVADEMVQERTRRKKTAKPEDKKPENVAKPEDKSPETSDEEAEGSEARSRRNKK
jgi:hypothetical protein